MPHFLSWIIIYGMALHLLAPSTGLVNTVLRRLGFEPIPFLNNSTLWVGTYVLLGVWQSVGWNTIIYLAALTSINPELYEAAAVDGASRFRMIWHVTLPGLRPTIITLLILSLGRILSSEFDRPYALGNALVTTSQMSSPFVYTLVFAVAVLDNSSGCFRPWFALSFCLQQMLAKRFGNGIW